MSFELDLIQVVITAASGLVGVGIGIGIFRTDIKQIKADLGTVKLRQAQLRGETNGHKPVFMQREDCGTLREACLADTKRQMEDVRKDLLAHTSSIKALDNFARWSMQRDGLKIEEINVILGAK